MLCFINSPGVHRIFKQYSYKEELEILFFLLTFLDYIGTLNKISLTVLNRSRVIIDRDTLVVEDWVISIIFF